MWVVTIVVVLPENADLPVGGDIGVATLLSGLVESCSIALSFKPGYRGRGCSRGALRVGGRWMFRVSIPFSMFGG